MRLIAEERERERATGGLRQESFLQKAALLGRERPRLAWAWMSCKLWVEAEEKRREELEIEKLSDDEKKVE